MGLKMKIEEQLAYYRAHPPRCIAKLRPVEGPAPKFDFDGHGEILNTYFQVGCPACGERELAITGHKFQDAEDPTLESLMSPFQLQCPRCQSVTTVFDTDKDGYDAELGHGSGYERATGPAVSYTCGCGTETSFATITARFEYPSDLFDDFFKDKLREDLFSWFTLTASCKSCGTLSCVADFECA
jgi:hypothetical protein